MTTSKQAAGLLVSLVVVAGIVYFGRFFTELSVTTWYPTIIKPSWTPSGATIGMVWTILYAFMAAAAWLVWRREGIRAGRFALTTYAVQLLLNLGWSALFFGFQNPGSALIDLGILWIVILVTTMAF